MLRTDLTGGLCSSVASAAVGIATSGGGAAAAWCWEYKMGIWHCGAWERCLNSLRGDVASSLWAGHSRCTQWNTWLIKYYITKKSIMLFSTKYILNSQTLIEILLHLQLMLKSIRLTSSISINHFWRLLHDTILDQ